jgi:hypothetical protein
LSLLAKENDFVITKLKAFTANFKIDSEQKNLQLPIPRWKFKILMETNEQISISLLNQWTEKGYLYKTDQRGDYREVVYELNPYLEKQVKSISKTKIPDNWIQGMSEISIDNLQELSYFSSIEQIKKVKLKYRNLMLRDIDELFLSYIMKNHKSVIILSGSLVELLLIYYCEKKHINLLSYQGKVKNISRKLYDADLGELLSYFENKKMLGDATIHLGNISRIYRNFVHPGKELRESEDLDQTKADLCFVSTIEIIKSICT